MNSVTGMLLILKQIASGKFTKSKSLLQLKTTKNGEHRFYLSVSGEPFSRNPAAEIMSQEINLNLSDMKDFMEEVKTIENLEFYISLHKTYTEKLNTLKKTQVKNEMRAKL